MLLAEPDPPDLYPTRKRWTREDCALAERLGILKGRYEIVDGEVIEKASQTPNHAAAVGILLAWANDLYDGGPVSTAVPIETAPGDQAINRPVADLALLAQSGFRLQNGAVRASDVALVIEVCDTTRYVDVRVKPSIYARAGVREYWVLDIRSRSLLVHRNPLDDAYGNVVELAEDETITWGAASDHRTRIGALLAPTGDSMVQALAAEEQ